MKITKSIHSTFTRFSLVIILLALGLWTVVWVQAEYADFKLESASLREQYISDQKLHLKIQVAAVVDHVNYMSAQTKEKVKEGIRQRVDEAHKIAWNIYEQNRETASPEVIKKIIKDALRPIRFNHGRGYFFAFNLDGIEELFADRPELEGTNMLAVQGAQGEYVVRDMLALVDKQTEGFYDYTWSKPGSQGEKHAKMAYVKLFKPYGWVLGTGEYIEDTLFDLQQEALARIASLRFGQDGYFFGSTLAGDSLFSNGKITRDTGGNILGLTDPNGVKIIQEQIRTVKESESGGFVHYFWNKLNETAPAPKLSFVMGVPEWQWVIGAGVYLDDIEEVITRNRSDLQEGLLNKIIKSVLIVLPLFILIFLWARFIGGKIKGNAEQFTAFFKKAAYESIAIDQDRLHYTEFKDIAQAANQMIEERNRAWKAMTESEQRYTSMFQNSLSVMLLIDAATGEIIDANSAACAFYGYEWEKMINKKISDFNILPPEQVHRKMEKARKTKEQYFTFQHRLANGDIRDVEVYTGPIGSSEKTVLFSIIHDITKRKQAENGLKSSEENLALVQKVAAVGSWSQEINQNKALWSDEMYRICGLDKEDFPANYESYLALVHPDDREDLRSLTKAILKEKSKYSADYRIVRPDNKEIFIHEQGFVVCDEPLYQCPACNGKREGDADCQAVSA